jgi:hypothetical protein
MPAGPANGAIFSKFELVVPDRSAPANRAGQKKKNTSIINKFIFKVQPDKIAIVPIVTSLYRRYLSPKLIPVISGDSLNTVNKNTARRGSAGVVFSVPAEAVPAGDGLLVKPSHDFAAYRIYYRVNFRSKAYLINYCCVRAERVGKNS